MSNPVHKLLHHSFVEDFDERYLPILGECVTSVEIPPNDVIFRQGEPAEGFYLINNGRVVVESSGQERDPCVVQTLSSGDALGWSWLFPPYRWHFTARAIVATELLVFPAEFLRAKATEQPEFGHLLVLRVAEVLAQRLRATRLQLIAATAAQRSAADGGNLP